MLKEIASIVGALLSVFFVLPIWLVLIYQILDKLEVSGFTWGLYIAYVPSAMLVGAINSWVLSRK